MDAGTLGCPVALSLSATEVGAQSAAVPKPLIAVPGKQKFAALSPSVTVFPDQLELKQAGGFAVSVKGRTYPIETVH